MPGHPQMIGRTIAHYRIEAELGRGGMGVVYQATDTRLDRSVALKFLPAELARNPQARERFRQEARAASALNHPHVCTIHEIGEADGLTYIAMELIEGRPLSGGIPAGGLSPEMVIRYGSQIAEALGHAHARGVVHRDLKSQNVMLTPDGRVKVLDFGLATRGGEEIAEATRSQLSLEGSQGVAGTLHYLAPEVMRGEPADARSDIWALGVVLYEMAAGRLPFEGRTGFEVSSAILREPPTVLPTHVPPGLRAVLLRCLAKDPGQRYQHAGEVRAALEALQSGAPPAVEPARDVEKGEKRVQLARLVRLRKFAFAAAAGMAVVLLLLILLFSDAGKKLLGRAGTARIQSLAVLPLANLSGDPQQDYFADGMTEALISNLAQIRALRVISRTTVMRYKGVSKPLPEIAKELGVEAVITGSVMRSDKRVRVSAQLIEAATDRNLWARQYDRDLRDVLVLQSEVARAVAAEVQIEVTPEVGARLAATPSVNPEAYDHFLRGRAFSRRENREDNDAAIELLERAVALDPDFPSGHAELSRAYRIRSFFFSPREKLWEQKAFAEVNRALELDPDSADSHLARGLLLWTPTQGFRHEEAIREFRRALDLKPSLDEAHHQLGSVYLHVGLLDEAQRAAEEAVTLNPGNTLALYRTGVVKLYQGKYQQAFDVFVRIPSDINPALVTYHTAWTLFYLGRKKEALTITEAYLAKHPEDEGGLCTGMQALFAADAGDAGRAEEKIRVAARLGKGYGHFHHTAYNIASAYALLGRPRPALEWLERAASAGLPCYPLYARDPHLDRIRRDPAFVAFLNELRPRWESYQREFGQ